jgi:lipoyl synthase
VLHHRAIGRVTFAELNDLQHALVTADGDYLLTFEHPPTYTTGIRAGAESFRTPLWSLAQRAAIEPADRGGDVTFHGPGQVVAWMIVTVDDDPSAGRRHVATLESAVIATVGHVDVHGALGTVGLLDGHPGVWAHLEGTPVKIAAVGTRVERDVRGRRRTLHGVAVNVTTDLQWFADIVPCGIADRPVGSLASLGCAASPRVVEAQLAQELADRCGGVASHASVEVGDAVLTGERALLRRLRRAGVDPDAGLTIETRKPAWLRIPAHLGDGYNSMRHLTEDLRLVTVCEEAGCPNIFECWQDGTATFMVNGERCTRACGFCLVDTRKPMPLDPTEPGRVAEAVARLGLSHAVVTCVARDDLADGGAGAIAATIRAIRERTSAAVEVLISDCKGDRTSQALIFDARPDVLNHNLETVARLQRAVRPSAGYARSLTVLARAKAAGLTTKSGLMVGLGETMDEVVVALGDLAAIGVDIVTIGQYLRPTREHLPVARWWTPEEFEQLREAGLALGLGHVQSSPLTRSSYHAKEAHGQAVEIRRTHS